MTSPGQSLRTAARLTAALLAGLALALPACQRSPELVPAVPERPAAALIVIPEGAAHPGGERPVLRVEVSATADSRRLGLSGRDSLPPDGGMLFVYGSDRERMFWMKDCLIGLDIAFVRADGTITDVATLPPGIDRDPLPTASSSMPVRYVLEAAAGWYAEHGIVAGDRVDLSAATRGVIPE